MAKKRNPNAVSQPNAKRLLVHWLNDHGVKATWGWQDAILLETAINHDDFPEVLKVHFASTTKRKDWFRHVASARRVLFTDWDAYVARAMGPKKTNADRRQARQQFYSSEGWRRLRYRVLKTYGRRCMCCGSDPKPGQAPHVDHIKPRSRYPDLELRFDNMQVLCEDCNMGKGAADETDWRPQKPTPLRVVS